MAPRDAGVALTATSKAAPAWSGPRPQGGSDWLFLPLMVNRLPGAPGDAAQRGGPDVAVGLDGRMTRANFGGSRRQIGRSARPRGARRVWVDRSQVAE
jgi:hypothetical protein